MLEGFGTGFGFVLVQAINIALIIAWVVLLIVSLLRIKDQSLPPTAKALWVVLIVVVPILGALAYLIVKPTKE